jgi:hypothetical protein
MKGASTLIVDHYFIQRPNEIIIKEKKKSHTSLNEPFKIISKDDKNKSIGYNLYDKNDLLGKLNIDGSLSNKP